MLQSWVLRLCPWMDGHDYVMAQIARMAVRLCPGGGVR